MRVVEELSRLDGAVGWNVMIAGNTSILWANLAHGRRRAIWPAPTANRHRRHRDFRLGHVPSQCRDGFRVSGRWPFASGCHQADWLVCVCHIVEDGEPRRAADGAPATYTFVLPRVGVRNPGHLAHGRHARHGQPRLP